MKDPSALSVFLDRLAKYIGYSLVLFIFVAGVSSIGQVFTSFGKHGVGRGQLLFRIGSLLICFTSLATIVLRNRRGRLAVVTRRWALLRLFVYLALGALIAISLAFTRNRQADHFHVSAFALSAFLTGGAHG